MLRYFNGCDAFRYKVGELEMALTVREKAAYALGAVGKDIVYSLASGYVLYYYQDILGVDAWIMGAILLAAKVLDAFSAPLMGMVVSGTHTRWGRFRPWMLGGTLVSACLLCLLFAAPPAAGKSALAVYAAVTYILWAVTYTMMDIPFWSMLPAFTRPGRQREAMTSLSRTAASLGAAFANVLTVKIVQTLGGGAEIIGFRRYVLPVSAFFILTIVLVCLLIREKPVEKEHTPGIREMLLTLVRNDQAMVIVLICVLVYSALFIFSNMLIYYFKYDFGGAEWYNHFTLFTGAGNAVQLLSMMFVLPLIRKKLTSERTFSLGIGMLIASALCFLAVMYTEIRVPALLLVPGVVQYTASGLVSVILTASLANTVEYGRWRGIQSSESIIFSMQAFTVKLTGGLSTMIVSVILSLSHLSEDGPQLPGRSSLTLLRLAMTLLPALLAAAGLWAHRRRFILTDDRMKEISKALEDSCLPQSDSLSSSSC